jgi:hypothetical protein
VESLFSERKKSSFVATVQAVFGWTSVPKGLHVGTHEGRWLCDVELGTLGSRALRVFDKMLHLALNLVSILRSVLW